jgi:hypothetical protein
MGAWQTHLRADGDVALCDLKPRRKLTSHLRDVTCQACRAKTRATRGRENARD